MNSHEAPENHTKVKFISLPINLQVREVLRGPSDHKSFLCRRKCLREIVGFILWMILYMLLVRKESVIIYKGRKFTT